VTLLLLVVGIHNAWDLALYSATSMPRHDEQRTEKQST